MGNNLPDLYLIIMIKCMGMLFQYRHESDQFFMSFVANIHTFLTLNFGIKKTFLIARRVGSNRTVCGLAHRFLRVITGWWATLRFEPTLRG